MRRCRSCKAQVEDGKVFCDMDCRRAWGEKQRKRIWPKRDCKVCGRPFRPRWEKHSCCGKACARVATHSAPKRVNRNPVAQSQTQQEEREAEARLRELDKRPPRLTPDALKMMQVPTWEW